jgi:hypothetical protein
MAITDVHGTQTATVTTEHTLADTAAAGTYVLMVNVTNMVAGDVLELRLYAKVLTGDTAGTLVAYFTSIQPGHTDADIQVSPPITTALTDSGAIRATLKQTKGTSRTFAWNLVQIA